MVANKKLQKLENWKLEEKCSYFQFPKPRNWKLEVSPIGDFQFPVSRQANKNQPRDHRALRARNEARRAA
jgi:hypothetical protein